MNAYEKIDFCTTKKIFAHVNVFFMIYSSIDLQTSCFQEQNFCNLIYLEESFDNFIYALQKECAGLIHFYEYLTWRDHIMLTGVAVAIIGLLGSLLSGATLLATTFAITTVILIIGSYFVYEYSSLEGIRVERARLEAAVNRLNALTDEQSRTVTRQQENCHLLETRIDQLEEVRTNLQTEFNNSLSALQQTSTELQQVSQDFHLYRTAQPQLQATLEQLYRASSDLTALLESRTATLNELRIAQAELAEARAEFALLREDREMVRAAMRTETTYLTEVRLSLTHETSKLATLATRYEQTLPQPL